MVKVNGKKGGKSRSYRDLDVWKLSIELVKEIYQVTAKFPPTEMYGITNQLRRAAISIPSNIAEGQGRNSFKEFKQLGLFNELKLLPYIGFWDYSVVSS